MDLFVLTVVYCTTGEPQRCIRISYDHRKMEECAREVRDITMNAGGLDETGKIKELVVVRAYCIREGEQDLTPDFR